MAVFRVDIISLNTFVASHGSKVSKHKLKDSYVPHYYAITNAFIVTTLPLLSLLYILYNLHHMAGGWS